MNSGNRVLNGFFARQGLTDLRLVLLMAGICGCSRHLSARQDAGVWDAGATDAAVAKPVSLEITLSTGLPDGGTSSMALTAGERPSVEPTTRLEVLGNMPLENYRIRIFDEADRALASNDEVKLLPGGLSYDIALLAPLREGHRYNLVLDAQTGDSIIGPTGHPEPDQRLEFQVAGERARPEPVHNHPPGKRRRRH